MEKIKAILIAIVLLSAYTVVSQMDYEDSLRHYPNHASR